MMHCDYYNSVFQVENNIRLTCMKHFQIVYHINHNLIHCQTMHFVDGSGPG